MNQEILNDVSAWMYRNARQLELCLWQYFFEDGEKEAVVAALMKYQNEDGGFGHALEADNWNPNSTPTTMQFALRVLRQIEFFDMSHPIYQGIWKYLNSEKDLYEYGWSFTVASTERYPHAPWWNYSEESNQKEYFGVTADLTAFILEFGDSKTLLYQKAMGLANHLCQLLLSEIPYGDMGIEGFITLLDSLRRINYDTYDLTQLTENLARKVKNSIEYDTQKWCYYGVRPSNYIQTPDSIFYQENEEIVKTELQYLLDTKPEHGVWGITWTWFENMDRYGKEFILSENWWKGIKAIEKMVFLRNFGIV